MKKIFYGIAVLLSVVMLDAKGDCNIKSATTDQASDPISYCRSCCGSTLNYAKCDAACMGSFGY